MSALPARAYAALRATRPRRLLVLLIGGGALIAFVRAFVPNQVYLPFYAYVVFAALFATAWESVAAIYASAAIIGLSFKDVRTATPIQAQKDIALELIFLLSALVLVALVDRLRRARVEAQAARDAAQAALDARDVFLATVSHDLKNPLLVIGLRSQALARRLAGPTVVDPAQAVTDLAAIDASVKKITRMIDDLIDRARLPDDTPPIARPTDLVALAGAIVHEYQQSTRRHHIRFDAAAPSLVGCWDDQALDRVVANLLSNAIKYSPTGGDITVRVCRDATRERAVLAVSDHGIGIPTRDLAHISARFHRAGNVGSITGTGLGLAGARAIVAQHGGTLDIASQEGVGTTVTVELPLPPT